MPACPPDARFLPEPEGALAAWRVADALSVRACLRTLRDAAAPLLLHLHERDHRLEGRLIAVNAPIDRLEIEIGRAADLPDALARATVVAFEDRIKVQFGLAGLRRVEGAPARLRALLPDVLHRIQRRDAYRVRPLPWAQARCAVPAPNGAMLPAQVLDTSIGGVSLRLPPSVVPQAGQRLADCQLSLPGSAAFRCDLLVTSVQPEAHGVRVGCAFEALSVPLQRTLQRFVFDADKRRILQARAARDATETD